MLIVSLLLLTLLCILLISWIYGLWFATNFRNFWPLCLQMFYLFFFFSWDSCYSWPLKNMDLNCMCPSVNGFFFNSKCYSTTPSTSGWTCQCRTVGTRTWRMQKESQISRANWKLYTDFSEFQLCGVSAPLTPELFKGQWHNVVCQLYLNFNFFNFIFV